MLLGADSNSGGGKGGSEDNDSYDEATNSFNSKSAQSKLKDKIKTQILNNMENLNPEESAKYDVLIEEVDAAVANNPEDISKMIEMLLAEGDVKFKND